MLGVDVRLNRCHTSPTDIEAAHDLALYSLQFAHNTPLLREEDMSWIEEAPVSEPWAQANVIRVMSINPKAMKAVAQLGQALTFGGSTLTRVQEELIATTVSTVNRCRY
jgi:alkylhydroperoxidase family enzyme